MARGGSQVPVP